ncbi:MAG: hypothetical protein ABIO70_37330, partial [Pseudomonadota bacterium]
MAAPSPHRWSRAPALILLGALLAWYGGSAWRHPLTQALGSAWSEAPGHLWGLWCTARGLWEHGPLVRVAPGLGFPDGFVAHLVDPIDLLPFLPGPWLAGSGPAGAVLGWNLLHLAAVSLAGLGCLRLGRVLAPGEPGAPWAWALLLAAFAGGAFLLSHPHMGRTEYLPAVLMPWHLAFLLPYARGERGHGAGVVAGLLLGGVALGGAYLAVFAAALEVPLALGLLLAARDRRRAVLARLALVAAVAALCALPLVAALLAWPPPGMPPLLARGGRPMPEGGFEVLLGLLRLGPRPDLEPLLDQPPYPGVVLLFLGLAGAALRPRQALGWLLLGLWLALVSLGPAMALPLGERPVMVLLPAGWAQALLPPLSHMKAWSRVGCLLPLPLGIAAFYGLLALLARIPGTWLRGAVGAALVTGVVADQMSWPRAFSLARPTFAVAQPRGLAEAIAALPPGAVIQLPSEVSIGKGIKLQAARSHLWQLQHGRAITATPGVVTDTSLRWSYLARMMVNLQFAEAEHRPRQRGPDLPGSKLPLSSVERAC